MGFQYPLLLETVEKYTTEETAEVGLVRSANEAAKRILSSVNHAKRHSEDRRMLAELQSRLDTAPFDKEPHPMSREFPRLDLTRHHLILDGRLEWRLGKNKVVELHVVLLEELIVLMTRVGSEGRLSLKYYDMAQMPDGKWCPVLKLNSLIAKTVATGPNFPPLLSLPPSRRPAFADKKAFFLVSTSNLGPQIYELVAGTMQEKKM